MLIRKMEPEDYPQVDKLMQKLHKMHVEARPDLYVPTAHILSEENYNEMLADSNRIMLLADDNGTAVGLCMVEMRTHTCMADALSAYMHDLFVVKSARHKGIATKLFATAEALAKAKGTKRLDLMVWSFNADAVQFYRSMDMQPQRWILEKPL